MSWLLTWKCHVMTEFYQQVPPLFLLLLLDVLGLKQSPIFSPFSMLHEVPPREDVYLRWNFRAGSLPGGGKDLSLALSSLSIFHGVSIYTLSLRACCCWDRAGPCFVPQSISSLLPWFLRIKQLWLMQPMRALTKNARWGRRWMLLFFFSAQ